MRVVPRVAERLRDPLLELLGDVVLEHLGLVVDAVPWHAQHVGQIRLEQAVVADHLERNALALVGQERAAVAARGSTRPISSMRFSIEVTDPGETPSRSASADVETAPSQRCASAWSAFA